MSDYVKQYTTKIKKGQIQVSKKVRDIYLKLEKERNDKNCKYYYNAKVGELPIEFIEKFCKQAEGTLGAPIVLDLWQKAYIQALFGWLDKETGYRRFKETMLLVGRKNGKALALDTPILTPNGMKTMGEINVGDYVIGQDGKPTQVTYTSPIFENHDCFMVEFEDGDKIVADAEHLWSVETKNTRRLSNYQPKTNRNRFAHQKVKNNLQIKTTSEIAKDFVRVRSDGKGKEYKYRVPMAKAIEREEKILDLNPYVLGVWLGDGASQSNRVYGCENDLKEICTYIEKVGVKFGNLKKDKTACFVKLGEKNGTHNDVKDTLKKYDLLNNKHIPEDYLNSSIEQRKELLRGLMDTDGTCSKNGECEFTQKSKRLTDDVSRLLTSLGIKHNVKEKIATCNGKNCGVVYRITFFVEKSNSCFRLKRKHERLKDKLSPRMRNKSIVNVEKVESVKTKCIAVDNEDHLYLCGQKNTVTHNTTLLSAIALYMLCADLEGGAECYSVATKKDQASKCFKSAVNMVKQSPTLREFITAYRSELYMSSTFSSFKALSSDSNTLDGLNTHLGIIDELHAIKDRNLYEVIQQSTSSRKQAMIVMITTSGTIRECIYDDIYEYATNTIYEQNGFKDDRFLPMLYELDDLSEWTNPKMWIKANPALGTVKTIEYLKANVNKAINDAKNLAGVLTKDFNIRQNSLNSWLTFTDIDNTATFDLEEVRGSYAVGGVDLSATTDLTCATILIANELQEIKVIQQYFIPMESLDAKIREDKIPYDKWAERGLITLCEGARVKYEDVTQWFVKMRDEYEIYVLWTGYDTWGSQYWATDMQNNGFVLESVIQGAKTMSTPMKELKSDFIERKINYNNNPVLKWCLCNVQIKVDENDNIRPVKKGTRQRIDGAVSLIDAYVTYKKHYDDYINMI